MCLLLKGIKRTKRGHVLRIWWSQYRIIHRSICSRPSRGFPGAGNYFSLTASLDDESSHPSICSLINYYLLYSTTRRDRDLRSLSPEAGKIFQVDSDERQRSIWKGHSMISIVHHASNAQSLTVTHANSHRWLGNRISNWIDRRLFSWKRLPLSCHRVHVNISERQQQRSKRFSKNVFDISPDRNARQLLTIRIAFVTRMLMHENNFVIAYINCSRCLSVVINTSEALHFR